MIYIYIKKSPRGPDEFVKRREMSPSTPDYTISHAEKGGTLYCYFTEIYKEKQVYVHASIVDNVVFVPRQN